MKITCSKCGKKIERTREISNAVCFNCKKERVKKRSQGDKLKRTLVRVENPHEDFSKFTKKLIINIPLKPSKKTVEYSKWLMSFKEERCYWCGQNLVILRRIGTFNFTKVCNCPWCLVQIRIKNIKNWSRI